MPLLIALVGCAALMTRGVGLPSADAASGHPAPSTSSATPGALADAEAATRGAATYSRSCQPCHQANGGGLDGQLAADLRARPGPLDQPDEVLLERIRGGVVKPGRVMPPFGASLTPEQQREVLLYVRQRIRP